MEGRAASVTLILPLPGAICTHIQVSTLEELAPLPNLSADGRLLGNRMRCCYGACGSMVLQHDGLDPSIRRWFFVWSIMCVWP